MTEYGILHFIFSPQSNKVTCVVITDSVSETVCLCYMHSPLRSISCSCCGNLQEVVTDIEVAHTSPEENLASTHTHTHAHKGNVSFKHQSVFVGRVPNDAVNCEVSHVVQVRLPSSSLCEVHTTSRQIFLSISTSASKKESSSSSVMSPVQTSLCLNDHYHH